MVYMYIVKNTTVFLVVGRFHPFTGHKDPYGE